MCDFIFEHRERQRKKHFCLLRCLSAFATPIKLYFRCVFKLLPYVALAFKSGYDFKVNSFYDTVITLANGEKLYVVVEILHRDSCENDEYMYGCRFVGIGAEDQFKIEAYQIVDTGSAI